MKKNFLKKLISAVITVSMAMSVFCAFSIEAFAAEEPYNLTQNGGVVATTTADVNDAPGLIDEEIIGVWNTYTDDAGNACYPAWAYWAKKNHDAVIDLGRICDVSEIKLHLGYYDKNSTTYMPTAFELYYSTDGSAYTLIDSQTGYTKPEDEYAIYTKTLDKAIEARYIKLTIVCTDTTNGTTNIVREIEVYGTVSEENLPKIDLALLPGVTATASVNPDRAAGLIDGNNTTADGTYTDDAGNTCYYMWSYWAKKDQYAIIDLGSECNINEFKLYLGYTGNTYSQAPSDFSIHYSTNGTDYTQIDSQTGITAGMYTNGIYTKTLDSEISARYIKLVIPCTDTENGISIRVRAFEIYGSTSDDIGIYYTLSEESSTDETTAVTTKTYTYVLTNNSDMVKNPVVFEVFYDGDTLESCVMKTNALGRYGDTWTVKYSYTEGSEPDKILVWSGLDNITPLKQR